MEGEQETVTEPVGFSPGWKCGSQAQEKETREGREDNKHQETQWLLSGSAPLPALSTFLETLHAATRGLLLISAPPEDLGLSSFLR